MSDILELAKPAETVYPSALPHALPVAGRRVEEGQAGVGIEVRNLVKKFGTFAALDGVDLKVADGELLALLGPSGSGKTTLLRIIAGLEWPDAGEVSFDGEDALKRGAGERHVGFVFQHYALFRHMTVFENVAFGLRVQPRAVRKDEAAIRARVKELLDLVQLDWLATRYPSQLSGGQRQRIALARALAIEPRILLLDEPFGALDAKVRKELRQWLRTLHEEINVTSIFVTHDQEEALEVANRVVVMDKGKIEQIGTPGDVYDNPATAFVHSFIGESIVLPVDVRDGSVRLDNRPLDLDAAGAVSGVSRLFVRRHDMAVEPSGAGSLQGTVRRVRTFGPIQRAEIALAGQAGTLLEVDAPRDKALQVGDEIGLRPRRYRIFAGAE
jgi:sulfate transport system ATP-binding protein